MDSSELIRDFLRDRLGAPPDCVVREARLAHLGTVSRMQAELIFKAEERLGFSIDTRDTAPRLVGDVKALLDRLLATKKTRA